MANADVWIMIRRLALLAWQLAEQAKQDDRENTAVDWDRFDDLLARVLPKEEYWRVVCALRQARRSVEGGEAGAAAFHVRQAYCRLSRYFGASSW